MVIHLTFRSFLTCFSIIKNTSILRDLNALTIVQCTYDKLKMQQYYPHVCFLTLISFPLSSINYCFSFFF